MPEQPKVHKCVDPFSVCLPLQPECAGLSERHHFFAQRCAAPTVRPPAAAQVRTRRTSPCTVSQSERPASFQSMTMRRSGSPPVHSGTCGAPMARGLHRGAGADAPRYILIKMILPGAMSSLYSRCRATTQQMAWRPTRAYATLRQVARSGMRGSHGPWSAALRRGGCAARQVGHGKSAGAWAPCRCNPGARVPSGGIGLGTRPPPA
jgi:hypothetical protein